jgi:hypothetical protein
MQRSNLLAAFILGLALIALSPLTAARSQGKAGAGANLRPPQAKEKTVQEKIVQEKTAPPRIEVFADRTTLKVGENINVTVWVESQVMESVEVKVSFPVEQLQLVGPDSQTVSLPQNSPLIFTFNGAKAGKSNLLVRASGKSKDKNEPLMATQKISGIEIQEQTYSFKSILSNSLFGALFGALLTFVATYLSDRRQKRKEVTQRKRWLTASLPAQIELNRRAVNKTQKADPDVWLSKMMAEGIYKDLQELTRNQPNSATLVDDLIDVSALLREYEKERAIDRAGAKYRQEISEKLESVITRLRAL